MIAIQGKDLTKSYGGKDVLKKVTFSVNSGDKVGVVGPNGAGKTTLFRCLTGEESPDSGQVMLGNGLQLGMLVQEVSFQQENTLEDEMMSAFAPLLALREDIEILTEEIAKQAEDKERLEKSMHQYQNTLHKYEEQGGYEIENKVRQVAIGLGFSHQDLKKKVSHFSGGQQTRINLAKLLLFQPDILLLDEPTNHLDTTSAEWLEGYLKGYPGTILVISHDRYFLDEISSCILEIEHGKGTYYKGNYSRYKKLKAEQLKAYESAYAKQQEYIKNTEEYIDRYRAGIKSKQARGRQKQLERFERMERPEAEKSLGFFSFPMVEMSGERVIELEEGAFSYDSQAKPVFQSANGLIRRGEKVGLVGPNGSGKTTLLKVLAGLLTQDKGEVRYGSKVSKSYYSQQHEDLHPEYEVLEEIVKTTQLGEKEGRAYLGKFLFSGDDVFKKVATLSGGEKSRLALLKLFLKGANLLFLDEPTNHLDIPSKEVLEKALIDYQGTVVLVSHDRYFLDQVTTKIWEFKENGQGISEFLGNYTYYRDKKISYQLADKSKEKNLQIQKKDSNITAREIREKDKEEQRRQRQLAREIEELEGKIAALEEEKENLSYVLAEPSTYSNGEQAKELTERYQQIDWQLTEYFKQWEELLKLQ